MPIPNFRPGVWLPAVLAVASLMAFRAPATTVRPENTDEILVNPDMGLVMFHYSNRQWAYGQLQERGDADGTPRIALPLRGGMGRRYPVGRVRVETKGH